MKLMQNIQMMGLAGLLVLGAGVADARGDRAERFAEIDADGDGKITQAEMRAHGAARFGAADTDGDGFLDQDEMTAQAHRRQAKRAARMLKRLDANEDGKLALSEMTGRRDPAKMFERLDKDGDGALSAEEFAKVGKRGHRAGKHGHKPASE